MTTTTPIAGTEPSPDLSAGPATLPPTPSLTRLAMTGSLWTIIGYGAGQIMRLAGNIILSRLLFPEAFGLMALVSAFIIGLDMFSDLGVAQSIIRAKDGDDREFLDTAWTLQVVRGAFLWLCSCLIAFPAAWYYDEPSLRTLLPIVGSTAFLAGLNATSLATLNRTMAFRAITFIELATQFAALTAMVIYAYFHRSVWSLTVGTVVAAALRLAVSHLLPAPCRNRFRWNRAAARELLHFGKWVFLSTLLTFVGANSDRFIFGKLGQMAWLGMYSIALALAALPTTVILKIGASVTFPAYSRIFARGGDLPRAFRRSRLPLLLVGGWMVTCLLVAGPSAVHLLYDNRYAGADIILQLLAIGVWFQVLECTNGALLLAVNDPGSVAIGNAAKLACMAVAIPIGFHLHGIHGAILALCLADVGRYATLARAVRRRGMSCLAMDSALTLLVAASTLTSLWLLKFLPPHLPADRFTRFLISVIPPSLIWLIPAALTAWEHQAVRTRLTSLFHPRRPLPA